MSEVRWSDFAEDHGAYERLADSLHLGRVQRNFLRAKAIHASGPREQAAASAPLASTVVVVPGCGLGNRVEYLVGGSDCARRLSEVTRTASAKLLHKSTLFSCFWEL